MRSLVRVLAVATIFVAASVPTLASAQTPPTCFGLPPTIVGTNGNDKLFGTPGPDVIVGRGGHDLIQGGDGDDVICGGGFTDYLIGGPGNDRLHGGQDSDTLVGGEGNDRLRRMGIGFGGDGNDVIGTTGRSSSALPGPGDDVVLNSRLGSVSFLFAPGPIDVSLVSGVATGEGTDQLEGIDFLTGSEYDDTIEGDDTQNFLYGRGGNDTITGLGLQDWIDGGPGDDELDGGGDGEIGDLDLLSLLESPVGADASLSRGTSTGPGNDTIVEFEHLWGSAFDDVLEGDDGPNIIAATLGSDHVLGLDGDDTIHGGSSGDAGPGTDECHSSAVANCEQHVAVDPYPSSRITSPLNFETMPADSFERVEAEAVGGLGPPVKRIDVALLLITSEGCRWWNERRDRLVLRACSRPRWNPKVEPDSVLPPGNYVAYSRAVLEDGTSTSTSISTVGKDSIRFFLD